MSLGESLVPCSLNIGPGENTSLNLHTASTTPFFSAVELNNITVNSHGKRECIPSSNDSLTASQSRKLIRTTEPISIPVTNQYISSFQNNANETEGTQTEGEAKTKYIINKAAAPMWTSARRHRLSEAKADMRSLHYSTLLEQDILPGPFLGVDKLPRYLLNDAGSLSTPMITLIKDQARARTLLAIDELRDQAKSDKRRAAYYNGICAQLYDQEEDTSYTEATELQTSLVRHFQTIESKRLQALFNKEVERKPTNDKEVSALLCRPQSEMAGTSAVKAPKRPRQPSTNRKDNANKPTSAGQSYAKQPKQVQLHPNTYAPPEYQPDNRRHQQAQGQDRSRSESRGHRGSRGNANRGRGRGNNRQPSGDRRPSPAQSPTDHIVRESLTRQQKDMLDIPRGLMQPN